MKVLDHLLHILQGLTKPALLAAALGWVVVKNLFQDLSQLPLTGLQPAHELNPRHGGHLPQLHTQELLIQPLLPLGEVLHPLKELFIPGGGAALLHYGHGVAQGHRHLVEGRHTLPL
ncbi:hypothetical protein ES707_15849 [subsurface metagenome]